MLCLCVFICSSMMRSFISLRYHVSVLSLELFLQTIWSPTTWPWWRSSRLWTWREISFPSLQTPLSMRHICYYSGSAWSFMYLWLAWHKEMPCIWSCYFFLSLFDSVTVSEKLDYFIARYAEHNHEKWCIEKVRKKLLNILILKVACYMLT